MWLSSGWATEFCPNKVSVFENVKKYSSKNAMLGIGKYFTNYPCDNTFLLYSTMVQAYITDMRINGTTIGSIVSPIIRPKE